MELLVDLHVHSHYSRATSRDSTLEGLYRWGKIKGISVIGTGDFTHPEWFLELRDKLVPAEAGLFALREELAAPIDAELPESVRGNVIRFVPSVEISTIYSRGGKVRKVHQLVIVPSFEAVGRINARLERIGNLKADGRPILGLDSRELLRLVLEEESRALYVPAHIWTPWFAVFGSKSGFDSLEEAYGELAGEVRAVETGLSSDPSMNWRVANLDGRAIISNSDAHSPGKLGREATVVRSELSFEAVMGAMKTNDERLVGTIEFFPQEGKYHYDGHRVCGVRFTPEETRAHGGMCPKCGKPLVVGVDYRVGELAAPERPEGYEPVGAKQVEYIIPLGEVLAELRGVKGASGRAVVEEYHRLIRALGPEFGILRGLPVEQIRAVSRPVAEAVERMRRRDVYLEPGYDGVFGVVKVFRDGAERAETLDQLSLL
ncbi:MAG TPA: endonuclease Q family protein [Candidatus Saccharimonadia bacterium]|nr:endonuclease Q family protein [Candidatus Saccharimonadia bacterium]